MAADRRSPSDPGGGAVAPHPAPGEEPPADGARRSGRRTVAAGVLVGAVIGLTCVAFVVQRMTAQWSEVRDEVADASLGWVAAALVLAAAGMTWVAACWRRALALSGPPPALSQTVAWYYAGEIGKYVPGGVWPVLGRGELARRGGVPRGRAYPSVGLSLAALYLAALAFATVLVPLDLAEQSESPAALALLGLLPLGLAALHPRVLLPVRRLVVRLTGRGGDVVVPPWRATVGLVVAYVPSWVLITAATWCTARALVPDPPLLRIGIATALSWTAGFVAVPVPAGTGVREAVFLAASGLPSGLGATVAVGSRLAFLVVDVLGAVVTAPALRGARRARPAPAEPADPDREPAAARP
ncbi:MAG: lysylphosphatidylglycerol synthase domain-containing protein [Thermoanaerobacterales bacterium]